MPPSGRFRGFLKSAAHDVKNVFRPSDQATTSRRTPSPLPQVPHGDTPPQPTPPHEPVLAIHSQPPAQSQSATLSQLSPTPSPPAPTASLLAVDGSQPVNAESSIALATKKAGADAWAGLKAALRLLEKSSDAFPPLKSAVGGFLGVIDIFENAAQNQKNYAEMASNLRGMVDEFKDHPEDRTSSNMSEALKAMTNELQTHMERQQGRSGLRRHVEAAQDVIDMQDCYRRVDELRRALQHKEVVKILGNQNDALDKIRRAQENQDVDAHLKELNAAFKAMYDSSLADVVGRRTCTPGTREVILAGMRGWADDLEGPKVYWLNGMAGTGKTTLVYSFCAEMQHARRLGASFFCSHADADSREVSKIVPTIAHQLARLLPSYREALIQTIGEDKEIGTRRTETQFEKLIRDPLREVEASVSEGIIVVIDALDECDRRDGARDLLNVLLLNARDLPIKFIVTCRPEPGLFDTLHSKDEHYRSVLHLHDIEASFVQADIKKYLKAELAETSLSPERLEMLAEQAGTLFIYAATAVRYIRPQNRQVNVHRRLDDLLSITSKARTNKHKGIDELYAAVLAAPFADEELDPQERQNIRLVLDTVICAREPMSAATMAKLLNLDDEQDVICALQHLRSVLHVSQATNLISTLHASFADFMFNQERSKNLCCDAAEHNKLLALRCFVSMQRLLGFNICELESSFDLDENVPNITKKIETAISPELFYACLYWGVHLEFTEASIDVHFTLAEFLSNRLLFWMEVLNLKKRIDAGAQMLTQVHAWLLKSGGANDALELALDAGRFVTTFGLSSASHSTPHIYISTLPFWPETRPVRLQYWKRMQGLVRLEGTGMERRNMLCIATWNTNDHVLCVAHSPDGTRIVSGSNDRTICVWDARSGDLVAGPFEGHTDSVNSVGFSPDGIRIVSGSNDNTVRVWDALSGDPIVGPFEGHTDPVISVGFSPDGTRIVSGSNDRTICVWDARSGDLVAGPFEGHADSVRSVGFSPDGIRIVSGSFDKTVRVWDARSGDLVAGPFVGHTRGLSSVGFSPDGTRIVSGSYDKTIRVWDARSGDLVAGPFEGHTNAVRSVGFSPDGTRIVSSSYDTTIRVWDALGGDLAVRLFEGHTNAVCSVGFSPDGTHIVSGSNDRTVRVWDARGGDLVAGPFEGHTDWVNSVGFSPDGTHIVSGSSDNTICVWDARSGDLVAGPFQGHTNEVYSVGFSPDCTRIVSSSHDNTIRVWDARSGDLVAGPFEGHTDWVWSVAFSPDGNHIVSGSDDKTIYVWDARSGDLVAGPFQGHTDWVWSVAFSPDGNHIVSGSNDKTVRVWDARGGDLVAEMFEGHTDSVNSVCFSPDGTCIASGSSDRTIHVWDARSGDLVAGPFEGHTKPVTCVGFSPDGSYIVSGSDDKTICVWDARNGSLAAGPLEGHTDSVNSVAFSPDGTCIVSGSNDNAIRVWATTPIRAHRPGHLQDWLTDETGVIRARQGQLMLCVPPDLWAGIVQPQNTICIHAKGILKPDFDDVLLGNEWTKCYRRQ